MADIMSISVAAVTPQSDGLWSVSFEQMQSCIQASWHYAAHLHRSMKGAFWEERGNAGCQLERKGVGLGKGVCVKMTNIYYVHTGNCQTIQGKKRKEMENYPQRIEM